MATAAEIESYNPNPSNAFGSTSLPAFSNAAVWDTTPAIQFWAQHAQNKLATAKALRDELAAKQLKEQAEIQKLLDRGEYKIWSEDVDTFNPRWNALQKEVIDVVNRGAWNDINDEGFRRVQSMAGELDQFAQFSTQQEKNYLVSDNDYNTDPKKWRDRKSIDDYRDVGDPFERAKMNIELVPQSGWEPATLMKDLVDGIVKENPKAVTTQADQYGNVIYSIPRETDLALLNTRINGMLDANRTGINGYEYEFSLEPDNVKAYYAAAPNPARSWAYDMALAATPLDLNAKNSIHQINYAPGSTTAATVPQFEYLTDLPVTAYTEMAGLKPRKRQDGLYEVVDSGGNVKTLTASNGDKLTTFTDIKDANEAINRSGSAITISPIGGWNVSSLAEYPANININAPTGDVYDLLNNKKLSKDEIGTDAWTVDVVSVFDWYRNKSNGALADKNQVKDSNRGNYDVVRLARVKKPIGDGENATYEIPYTDNIKIPLENALRKAKIPESDFPSNVPLGGLGGATNAPQTQLKKDTTAPKTLTGKIDPKTLVVGNSYIVNGKTYIWDGTKLKPQ